MDRKQRTDFGKRILTSLHDLRQTDGAKMTPDNIRPAHLDEFRAAAAGIVVQAAEAAKEAVSRTEEPPMR
jgi:hypothetical protein